MICQALQNRFVSETISSLCQAFSATSYFSVSKTKQRSLGAKLTIITDGETIRIRKPKVFHIFPRNVRFSSKYTLVCYQIQTKWLNLFKFWQASTVRRLTLVTNYAPYWHIHVWSYKIWDDFIIAVKFFFAESFYKFENKKKRFLGAK